MEPMVQREPEEILRNQEVFPLRGNRGVHEVAPAIRFYNNVQDREDDERMRNEIIKVENGESVSEKVLNTFKNCLSWITSTCYFIYTILSILVCVILYNLIIFLGSFSFVKEILKFLQFFAEECIMLPREVKIVIICLFIIIIILLFYNFSDKVYKPKVEQLFDIDARVLILKSVGDINYYIEHVQRIRRGFNIVNVYHYKNLLYIKFEDVQHKVQFMNMMKLAFDGAILIDSNINNINIQHNHNNRNHNPGFNNNNRFDRRNFRRN